MNQMYLEFIYKRKIKADQTLWNEHPVNIMEYKSGLRLPKTNWQFTFTVWTILFIVAYKMYFTVKNWRWKFTFREIKTHSNGKFKTKNEKAKTNNKLVFKHHQYPILIQCALPFARARKSPMMCWRALWNRSWIALVDSASIIQNQRFLSFLG